MRKETQALIFVLFILMIVGILVGALMVMWNSQIKTHSYQKLSLKSYYLAQAGIEHANVWAENNLSHSLPYTYTSSDWGGSEYYSFRVEAVPHRPNQRHIIASGWKEEGGKVIAQRNIELTVNISSLKKIRWSWRQK